MKNETVLITGASSGIGREMAMITGEKGYNLILTARSEDRMKSLQKELTEKYSVKIHIIPIDLTAQGAPGELLKRCEEKELTVDILINNAGMGLIGNITDTDPEELYRMVELNIQAVTGLSALFAAKMKKQGRGKILNIGSLNSHFAIPYFAAYAATKAYVRSFTLALRSELKGSGVSVSCFEPGFVRTSFDANAKITSEKYLKMSRSQGMSPSKAADLAVKTVLKGRRLVVGGFFNKIGAAFSGIIPGRISTALFKSVIGGLLD